MAKGGWSHGSYEITSIVNSQAGWEAAWDAMSLAITGLGVGWSVEYGNQIITNQASLKAWWRGWVHSSGARLLFMMSTDRGPNSTNLILNQNNQSNQSNTGTNSGEHMGFAYLPPGHDTFPATTPYTAGFIPNGGFRFGLYSYNTQGAPWQVNSLYDGTGGKMKWHFIAKGDDLVILHEYRSDTQRRFDAVWIMGTFIGTLAHPAEETNSDLSNECFLGMLTGLASGGITVLNSADSPVEFYRTPGIDGGPAGGPPATKGRSRVDGSFITWETIGLGGGVNKYPDISDTPWVSPLLYYSDAAIDTNGVIAGNGLKGTLDPDKIRVIPAVSGANPRQLFDGGNFMYVGGDLLVPWDPALPPID